MIGQKVTNSSQQESGLIQPRLLVTFILVGLWLASCSTPPPRSIPSSPPLAKELVFYDWAEDMPETVLDAFTAEYGIKVTYLTYETQDESLTNLRAGKVYDVVIIDNDYIPGLVAEGLLAEIDYDNVPNFKNILPNFRDLAYDPQNKHTIPFNWGTTGLLVRSDLVQQPISHWADLWDLPAADKIGMRGEMRDLLGPSLKALGYSANSVNPRELEAALAHLLKIRQKIVIVDSYAEALVPLLIQGEIVVGVGWADDALQAQEANPAIDYVLPEEGALVWGDNFVIPANSPNKYTAEVFLNFLLQPEISAQIVNENYFANANQAAHPFIDPEIRDNPVIFPSNEALANTEIYFPLSPEEEKLYTEIWQRFMNAATTEKK